MANFLQSKHHIRTFYDRDSLTTPEHRGKPFPPLIFEAILHAKVAIVLLSKNFFEDGSDWPRIELEAILLASYGKKIGKVIPLFYGVSKFEEISGFKDWNSKRRGLVKLDSFYADRVPESARESFYEKIAMASKF
jgi:hypothetical protein